MWRLGRNEDRRSELRRPEMYGCGSGASASNSPESAWKDDVVWSSRSATRPSPAGAGVSVRAEDVDRGSGPAVPSLPNRSSCAARVDLLEGPSR